MTILDEVNLDEVELHTDADHLLARLIVGQERTNELLSELVGAVREMRALIPPEMVGRLVALVDSPAARLLGGGKRR